jgi:SAM-dependent methyltransferase
MNGNSTMLSGADRYLILGERPEAVERIDPSLCAEELVSEHSQRYRWAGRESKDCRVLDLAAGTGYGTAILRALGAGAVISADISLDAMRYGRELYSTLPICVDAHRLPFGSSSFDRVVSLETIEHLANPHVFLHEIQRVLRLGGSLVLSTPNARVSRNENPYHLREFEVDEISAELEKIGLKVVRLSGQHWLFPWDRVQRVKGLRRLVWMAARSPRVLSRPIPKSEPVYWCIQAVKCVNPNHD